MGRAQLYTCDHCREAHRVDVPPIGGASVLLDEPTPPPGWSQLEHERRPRLEDALEPCACVLEPDMPRDRVDAGERFRLIARPQLPFRLRRVLEQVPGAVRVASYMPERAKPLPMEAFTCHAFLVGTENQLATVDVPLHALSLADTPAPPCMPGVQVTLDLEPLASVDVRDRVLWLVGETPKRDEPFRAHRGALLCPRCSSGLQLLVDGKPLQLVDVEAAQLVGPGPFGDDVGAPSLPPMRWRNARRVR